MAIRTFSVNDTIADFVTNMNGLSTEVGDPMLSSFAPGKNIVDQINILRARVAGFDDSSEIVRAIRSGISVEHNEYGNLTYDPNVGKIEFTPPVVSDIKPRLSGIGQIRFSNGQMLLDSGVNASFIINETVSYTKFKNVVTFEVLDSDGTNLYTFKSPGI